MSTIPIYEARNIRILFWALCLPAMLIMIWSIFSSINEINEMLDDSNPPVERIVNDFEIGNLKLTKTTISTSIGKKTVAYVTTKELSYLASKEEQNEKISTNYGFSKMTGLESYPSFLVTEKHKDFWKSQFHLKIIFNYLGYIVLFLIMLVYSEVNIHQNRKLFTKEIKWLFGGILFLVFISYLINGFMYGRMISFLNREFYLGESLVGGLSQELNWLMVVLLFLIIFIEKAIPIQKEQDLTV